MPTYSYRCTDCSTAFDIQQAFTDDTLTVCPSCEGRLRKVFSAVGVTFNGSGFYRTDSRAGAKGSGDSSSSGSGSGATETTKKADSGSSGSSTSSSSGSGSSASPSTSSAPAKATTAS